MYKKYFLFLILVSLAGLAVTIYLTYQHYSAPGTTFCNVSEYVSCDIVNKSIYASIFGVPVAILGLGAYLVLFLSSLSFFVSWKHASRILVPVTFFAGGGLIFSLYLSYIEFFVLYAVCIMCVTQQLLILLIFLTLLYLCSKQKKASLFV